VNLPKNYDLWAAVNLSFYEALVQWSLQGKKSPNQRFFLYLLREAQQTPELSA
jgi:hypothetical protein